MTKKPDTFPQAANDFYKTNGFDATFRTAGPSMTRQEFADECDINALMKRYESAVGTGPGGLPPMGDPASMFYADFTQMPGSLIEYHEFMFKAEASFMALPAQVRREFDNDPVTFVEFAQDPANIEQLRTWGLAPPAKPKEAPPEPTGGTAPPKAPEAPAGSQEPVKGEIKGSPR